MTETTTQSSSVFSINKSEMDLIKRIENKEKNLNITSSIIKISTITVFCILLAFISISIFSIYSMKATSQKLANTIGVEKIDNETKKLINTNIVKYIIKMTVITFAILLVFIALIIIGYKYKFFNHRVKLR